MYGSNESQDGLRWGHVGSRLVANASACPESAVPDLLHAGHRGQVFADGFGQRPVLRLVPGLEHDGGDLFDRHRAAVPDTPSSPSPTNRATNVSVGTSELHLSTREEVALRVTRAGQTFVWQAPAWEAHLTGMAAGCLARFEAECRRCGLYWLVLRTPAWACFVQVQHPAGTTRVSDAPEPVSGGFVGFFEDEDGNRLDTGPRNEYLLLQRGSQRILEKQNSSSYRGPADHGPPFLILHGSTRTCSVQCEWRLRSAAPWRAWHEGDGDVRMRTRARKLADVGSIVPPDHLVIVAADYAASAAFPRVLRRGGRARR